MYELFYGVSSFINERGGENIMNEANDEVALIVGGGPGISASCARLFNREGMQVAIAARTTDKEALQSLRIDHDVKLFQCDATEPSAVKELFETVKREMGTKWKTDIDENEKNQLLTPDKILIPSKDMKNNFIELDSKQAWLRLIIIFTMSVIGTAGMWSVVIIMPNIQNEFGLDRAASTYPYVATMFGYGIGNVIIGRMLDKIGIRKPIIFALILLVSSYLFSVLATNVFWLSIIQFFLGFSAAAFFGPMMADISKFFYKRKGLAVSLVASGQHLCGAIWPFLIKDFF